MDPLTHLLFGAVAAQAMFNRRLSRWAPAIGALAAVIPDIAIWATPGLSPLARLQWQAFAGAPLVWIPISVLITTLIFFGVKPLRYRRPAIWQAALLGSATAYLLNLISTTGFRPLEPMNPELYALDWVSSLNPLLILILLIGGLFTLIRKNPRMARLSMFGVILFVGMGAAQHQRAVNTQMMLAQQRGQTIQHSRVLPMPGSLVIWRSFYAANGLTNLDALRVPWNGESACREGSVIRLYTPGGLPHALRKSRQQHHTDRLNILSGRWLVFAPGQSHTVVSLLDWSFRDAPESIRPTWEIKLDPTAPDTDVRVTTVETPPGSSWRDRISDIFNGQNKDQPFVPILELANSQTELRKR